MKKQDPASSDGAEVITQEQYVIIEQEIPEDEQEAENMGTVNTFT